MQIKRTTRRVRTIRGTPRERFDDKYIPEPNSGCWLWIAGVSTDGYPTMNIGGKITRATRFIFSEVHGKIPPNMEVCHSCDLPVCVNPDHLFLGTHQENMQDHSIKRRNIRSKKGSEHLTESDVLAIRQDTRPQKLIRAQYKITKSIIDNIKGRRSWTHIP